MNKLDFKNGMSFIMRNREKRFIINDGVYGKGWDDFELKLYDTLDEHINKYHENFTRIGHHPLDRKLDIMKIYDCDNNLIWERQEIDWSKVPIDTKVLVRNSHEHRWDKRYFAKYENEKVFTFINGYSSWSVINTNYITSWKYARLAETEEPKKKESITCDDLRDLEDKIFKYCTLDNNPCSKCEYHIYDDFCKIAWLLDNYNVTEK